MGGGLSYVLKEELDKSCQWNTIAEVYPISVSQGW